LGRLHPIPLLLFVLRPSSFVLPTHGFPWVSGPQLLDSMHYLPGGDMTYQPTFDNANLAPRCTYLRMDGEQCLAPALRGKSTCRSPHPKNPKDSRLPLIEDAASIQLALNQVLRALQDGHFDLKLGALLLYGLQTASANLRNYALELDLAHHRRE